MKIPQIHVLISGDASAVCIAGAKYKMITFLDFDGVLHHATEKGKEWEHLERLEEILREHPEIKVVISSSWRESYSLEELRRYFSPDIRRRIIGQTPVIDSAVAGSGRYHRYEEIMVWLKVHACQKTPWLALDDDRSLFRPGATTYCTVRPRV